MGMYNEVWKSCPKCGKKCCAQISQIVDGFGHFDLDDPEALLEDPDLDVEKLRKLEERVREEVFNCRECKHRFRVVPEAEDRERREIVGRLCRTDPDGEDT
jgi:hypothetical protein